MRHSAAFYAIRRTVRLLVGAVLLLCIVGFPTMSIFAVLTHPAEAVPVLLIAASVALVLLVWALIDSFRRANAVVDAGIRGDA